MDDSKQQSSYAIQDLLNNIDIVSVIKNYINLSKKGQNYWGLCPFHGDKNPSLSVNSNKKVFKCFVCGESGNAIKFVQKFKKINFYQAIKEIVEITNYKTSVIDKFLNSKINSNEIKMYDMNNQACFIYHRTLFNSSNADKLKYLLSRNLTQDLINEYKIGYAPNSSDKKYLFSILTNEDNIMGEDRDASLVWSPIQLVNNGLANLNDNNEYSDFFWNRIIIPIFDEHNNVIGFSGRALNNDEKIKYINTKTTEIFKKENVLFNFNNFDKSIYEEIFVVEGYMDVFAFRKMGIKNVVASMGTSFTSNQINLIKKYKNINSIIICFDNDEAGFKATIELAQKLYNHNIKVFVVAPYDKSYKDIDELLKSNDKNTVLEVINNQISFISYLCIKMLSDKSLTNKEIVLRTKKILDNVISYSYDELTLDNDLLLLSKFSSISVDALNQYIKKELNKNKKEVDSNIKNSNKYFSFPIEYNIPRLNIKTKPLKEILNEEKSFEVKEKDLFKIVAINTYIAELFIKNIYHSYFQSDIKLKQIFTELIYFAKILIDNSIDVNPENLLSIIKLKEDEFDKPLNELVDFIKSIIAYYNKYPINNKSIIYQGVSLILDLVMKIQQEIQKIVIRENCENVYDEYRNISNQYDKKIKELLSIKNNLQKG
ncbi:DNA primase [Malacoplasma muris]|uniref:DNA primase n=1 Tax=Malacoplasma muris TaxID=2119 RepID=UPI00398F8D22